MYNRIFFYYIDDGHLGFQWTIMNNASVDILICVPMGALVLSINLRVRLLGYRVCTFSSLLDTGKMIFKDVATTCILIVN